MKLNKKLMGALLGGLLVISCSTTGMNAEKDRDVEYKCGEGKKVVATFMNSGDTIKLNVDGKMLNMDIKRSGSGSYYEGDNASFHIKGNMGILTMDNQDQTCKVSKW